MIDELDFQEYPGDKSHGELILLALSTCGFCNKAKKFFEENEIAFKHIFLDAIDKEKKKEFKAWFTDTFEQKLYYPTLIIERKELMVGFVRGTWEEKFL